jgi:hypothetical protein
MEKFIIVEILDAECFNDPKCEIFQDNNGNPIIFDSIKEAKECGIAGGIPEFVIYKKVSRKIKHHCISCYGN